MSSTAVVIGDLRVKRNHQQLITSKSSPMSSTGKHTYARLFVGMLQWCVIFRDPTRFIGHITLYIRIRIEYITFAKKKKNHGCMIVQRYQYSLSYSL